MFVALPTSLNYNTVTIHRLCYLFGLVDLSDCSHSPLISSFLRGNRS